MQTNYGKNCATILDFDNTFALTVDGSAPNQYAQQSNEMSFYDGHTKCPTLGSYNPLFVKLSIGKIYRGYTDVTFAFLGPTLFSNEVSLQINQFSLLMKNMYLKSISNTKLISELSDVKLIIENGVICETSSMYLVGMFSKIIDSSFIEGATRVIELREEGINTIIEYLHTGEICIKYEDVFTILYFAHQYNIEILEQDIDHYLQANVTNETFETIFRVALFFNLEQCKKKIIELFQQNDIGIYSIKNMQDLNDSEIQFLIQHAQPTQIIHVLSEWSKNGEDDRVKIVIDFLKQFNQHETIQKNWDWNSLRSFHFRFHTNIRMALNKDINYLGKVLKYCNKK